MVHRPEAQWLPLVRSAGFLVALLTAGCAWMDRAPPDEAPAVAPQQPAAKEEKAAAPRRERAARKPAPVAAEPAAPAPVAAPPSPPPATIPSAVKPDVPAAKPETVAARPEAPDAKPQPSADKPAAKASPPPAPKKEGAAAPAPRPAAPTLDLAALETRLKETSAIGVFTKLTLKNQVDDLLNRFRAFYQGRAKTTLAELRQPYDLLILKVLTLLQDGDPSLASAIRASREAIWAILTDREKFSKLAS
jgi:hypothetical protein